ncbi:MAG: hypothetical protein HRU09_07815 [Oligoflexales bacterium]|nr:hypothetical protein [Oligoflexales bacterium]
MLSGSPSSSTQHCSEEIVVYRSTSRPLGKLNELENINLGNLYGQLGYLESQLKYFGEQKTLYLKALKIRVNLRQVSDYYHCEKKECEFRLTCQMGPCKTPLPSISSQYKRVGIKLGADNIQLSRCGRSYVCPEDVCLPTDEGEAKFKACLNNENQNLDCYYGFTKEGNHLSYEIIGQSESKKINWEGSLEDQLRQLAKEAN